MTVAFDTLKFADRLAAGGFTDEQAKTAAVALADTFGESVATKADLDRAVERLDARIDAVELRLTVKVGAMLVVMVGVIGVLFKLLH